MKKEKKNLIHRHASKILRHLFPFSDNSPYNSENYSLSIFRGWVDPEPY